MLSSVVVSAILSSSHRPEQDFLAIVASAKNEYYESNADEDYDRRQPKRYNPREQSFSTLGGLLKNQKQLGAGLLGVGALLTVMGMMLFFEGTLLRLGNVSIGCSYLPDESKLWHNLTTGTILIMHQHQLSNNRSVS